MLKPPEGPPGRERWLVLAVAALFILPGLGLREPWPADEPRFALVASQMAAGGDWWFPHRGAELYADKPPLTFWAIALLLKAGLPLQVAFLLPSMLAGIGSVLLLHDLAERLWGRRRGLYAAGALLSLFAFTWQARQAQLDATLGFWCMLGTYGLVRHLLLGPAWGWWWTAWAAMGAGVITKGVGIVPALMLAPWALARWRGWAHAPAPGGSWWRWSLGPLAFAAVIAAWLVPMAVQAEGDPARLAYRAEILFSQTAERYARSWQHETWFGYFLVEVIPPLWAPVSLLVPWAAASWWRRLRRHDARQLVLLGGALLIVLFFSIPKGKRGVYVLPAAPLLVLALTPLLPGLCRRAWLRTAAWAMPFATGSLLLAAALAAGPWLGKPWGRLLDETGGWDPRWAAGALGAAALAIAWWAGRRRGLFALAGFLAVGWLTLGLWIWPALDDERSSKSFMAGVAARVPASDQLGLAEWPEQLLLHCPRPAATSGVRRRGDWQARERAWAAAWMAGGDDRWLLIPAPATAGWGEAYERIPLGERHRREWVLLHRP